MSIISSDIFLGQAQMFSASADLGLTRLQLSPCSTAEVVDNLQKGNL